MTFLTFGLTGCCDGADYGRADSRLRRCPPPPPPFFAVASIIPIKGAEMPRKSTIITCGDIFDSLTTMRRKRAVNAVYGGVISTLFWALTFNVFIYPLGNPANSNSDNVFTNISTHTFLTIS